MGTRRDRQLPVGEQNNDARKKFRVTNYKQCPICKSKNIAVHWWSSNGRSNGDGWGTVVCQCLGNESIKDVEDLGSEKKTRILSGRHGCGFYRSFYYHEGASLEYQMEAHGWIK